ncbi:MAG: amino acid--tRNA ligase-related protein, partial [Steroidobacteraceae bacterium]
MSEPADEPRPDENKLIAERRGKLNALRTKGEAYPNDFRRDSLAGQLHTAFGEHDAEWFDAHPTPVRVGGRMLSKRVMGKASFTSINDRTGSIQLFLQASTLGDRYDEFKGWDVGDIVGAEGMLFRTRTGELSVRVEHLDLLVKSLRPLPDKWHGLTDLEQRYRQRYVDLAVSPDVREVFKKRSAIVRGIRSFLDSRNYLEVETPMMHPIIGGAAARPFVTHHNALDMKLFMRIAPELYLKRLVVGGFDRVYEINRNFRNEGLSRSHNPEFTMLEFYQAYATYTDLMDLTEQMVGDLAREVNGGTKVTWDGVE